MGGEEAVEQGKIFKFRAPIKEVQVYGFESRDIVHKQERQV